MPCPVLSCWRCFLLLYRILSFYVLLYVYSWVGAPQFHVSTARSSPRADHYCCSSVCVESYILLSVDFFLHPFHSPDLSCSVFLLLLLLLAPDDSGRWWTGRLQAWGWLRPWRWRRLSSVPPARALFCTHTLVPAVAAAATWGSNWCDL